MFAQIITRMALKRPLAPMINIIIFYFDCGFRSQLT